MDKLDMRSKYAEARIAHENAIKTGNVVRQQSLKTTDVEFSFDLNDKTNPLTVLVIARIPKTL